MGDVIRRKRNYIILLIMFLVYTNANYIYASSKSHVFELRDLTPEEIQENNSYTRLQSCGPEKIKNLPIETLVVGNDWVAVGTAKNCVAILDFNGAFINGINFNTKGMYKIYTDETGKNLYINIVRRSVIYILDCSGEILSVKGLKSGGNIKKSLFENNVHSTGTSYILKRQKGIRGIFSQGYSKVIEKDLKGNEKVFYDSNYRVGWLMVFLIFATAVGAFKYVNWVASFPSIQNKWKK